MKVRSGFVSNSSSSCFLISFTTNLDIYKLFKETNYNNGEETYVSCVGADEVLEWAKDNIFDLHYEYTEGEHWDWRKYRSKEANKFMVLARDIAQEVKEGKQIASISVDYNDSDAYKNLDTEGIKIIRDWN